jgi:hypothetical protein
MSGPFRATEKLSGFNPKSVQGLQLWLDASDSTTITKDAYANVSQWNDKSSNAYQAIQNSNQGRDPATFVTGAQNYVSLAPNQAMVVPNFSYTTSWSVFSCMNNITAGARWYISPYSDAQIVLMSMYQSGNKIFSGLLAGSGDITGRHIEFTAAQNTNGTGAYVYYRDGTIQDSNNTLYNQGATTVNLGIGANGASGYDAGGTYYIYEILIYNTYLSDTDRQNIESYLAQKWSMTGNLDPSHIVVSLGTSKSYGYHAITESVFNPRTAGPCALWLDASDVNGNGTTLADQTAITKWVDKSGNNRSTTLSGTIKYNAAYLNGNATLSFSPANSSSVSSSIASALGNGDYALVAVWKITVSTTAVVLAVGPNANSPSVGIGTNLNGGGCYNLFEWGCYESDYVSSLLGYVIHIGTRISGYKTAYINGNAATTTGLDATLQNITNTTVTIGNGDSGVGFPVITGEICELAIYNGTLTDSTRQQLEGYFSKKWSIPLTKPGHPYAIPRYQIPYPIISAPRKGIERQFNPANIGGCVLWLDAADTSTLFQDTAGTISVTSTGQIVQLWKDKSTSANNASNASSTMTYSSKSIYFPGNQSTGFSLNASLLPYGTSDSTWFFIFNTTSADTLMLLSQGSGGSALRQIYLAGGNLQADESGVGGISGSIAVNTGTNVLYSLIEAQSTTTLTGRQNGSQFASITFTFNIDTNAAYIGSYFGAFLYAGFISEILVFNKFLTTDLQRVEGYLAWKWGVQKSLPPDHPHILFPPPS